jgi:predicted metal-dependent enzyme (double-stranded beta helix superfamily)
MAHFEALETYTRTISTMSEVLEALRDEPDPDGSITALADRITVEREWVRGLLALDEEPRRPRGWLRRVEMATHA